MKVSVIITAYNCEKFIQKALKSVFSQTFSPQEYEIIVVNDGSTDNTLNLLKEFQDKITIIDQSNKGFVEARNTGIQNVKGENIIILDADDYLDKEMLYKAVNSLECNPDYECVYTDRYEIDIVGNSIKRIFVGEDNIFNMLAAGILFRRHVFDVIGLYDDLLFEEYDFMIRFIKKFRSYYLREPLYYYVKHGSNMTAQDGYWERGWNQLLKKWGKDEVERWVAIQSKEEGTSRFLQFMEN